MRLASGMARLAVRLLGWSELTAEPVDLGLQIPSAADPRPSNGLGESLARQAGLVHGVRPGALQLHQLGAVQQALATIGHQVRLRCAPTAHRRRPLARPAQIPEALAFRDHSTVDGPDTDRRHLAGRDGDHDLVEQRHALRDLPRSEQRLANTEPTECHQLGVAEALADHGGLIEGGAGGRGISPEHAPQGEGQKQVPALHAVVLAVVEESLASSEPSAAARRLALHR